MRLIDRWTNRLLDERTDARPLGVMRVVLGVAALLMTIELAEGLVRLGSDGIFRFPVVDAVAWIPGSPAAPILIGLWACAAVALMLGWHTRPAAVTLVLVALVVLGIDQQLYSNHLTLLTVLTALTGLANGGAALSLDARAGRGSPLVPAWGIGLIKIQITSLYLFAALSKLNPSYLSGSVMASYLRTDGPLAVPESWRAFEPMLVLSLIAVMGELFLAIALWLPRWRRNAFVVGLGLHGFILLTFQPPLSLLIFGLASLSPYVLFLDAAPASRLVIWDGSCSFCAGWVTWWRRLDWLGALRFTPMDEPGVLAAHGISELEAAEALHVVGPDGTTRAFAAVRSVAEVLPISFLWAPLLALPPVQWLGERVYRAVARRRSSQLPMQATTGHPG
jgi:predicted DCC family thiol-disulfide oxidoreductase YuxK